MHVNAIIVAAGKGERMGAGVPKSFLTLAGVPLVVHTLRRVLGSSLIRHVILVVAADHLAAYRPLLDTHGPFRCPVTLVPGGERRQDSVRSGLAEIEPGCEIVVIHDAARPLVQPETIDRSIAVAAEAGGALVAVPVHDTLKRVDMDGTVIETVPRRHIWLAQTPQAFRVAVIREAHQRALRTGTSTTDDAALVEEMGGTVKIVPGDPLNLKITVPEDFRIAELLAVA